MLSGSYDYRLVALSVVLAMVASYAALDLVVASPQHRVGRGPFGRAGAAAMGLGIWPMHYVGMLALTIPVPVSIIFLLCCFHCWPRCQPRRSVCLWSAAGK